jgi:PmbA protein
MSKHLAELMEQATWVMSEAQKRGAKGARVRASRNSTSSVEWRDGKLDRIRESTSMSVGVTLLVDGRYSSSSTSDLRKPAMEKFLDEAIAMTRAISEDSDRVLPDPARYAGQFGGDLKVYDDATATLSPDWLRRKASELEAAARAAPGSDKIVSVSTTAQTDVSEQALAVSNGMHGTHADSTVVLVAETSVRDKGGRKPEGWWYAACPHREALPSIELIGRKATERALARIGESRRPTGKYACIVEAMTAGRLLDSLLSALNGSNIQQRKSFLADKLDQRVGSAVLSIVDEPHLAGGLGSRVFDGEGMATRKRPVFDKGVVKSFFLDTYYGRKLGKEPTSGGRTNLAWPVGQRDPEALMRAMGKGILITGFNGGNSNTASGDFSFGIQGQWVEGGKIVAPVSEMNLAGNHLEFWKRLVELGNDPFLYSSNRRPSLRFDKVQFSGT